MNNQVKHTSGPWKTRLAVVNNAPNTWVVTNGKWGAPNIAECSLEANARLIAAAPDMDRVIDYFLEAYEAWNNRQDGGEDDLHYAAKEARKVKEKLYV